MNDARDARATRLLDKRWHWMTETMRRLYAELENGDQVIGITVGVRSGGQWVSYGLTPLDRDVQRHVIPDPGAAADAISEHLIDVTPDPGSPS